jgi:hypothetical protein
MKPRFGLALALVLPAFASGCGGGEGEGPGYVATIKPAFVAAEESFADTIVPCLQREYDECAETGRAGRAAAQALIGKLEETSSPPEVRDAHQQLLTSFRGLVRAYDDQAAAIRAEDDAAFDATVMRISSLVTRIDNAAGEIEAAFPGTDLPSMH